MSYDPSPYQPPRQGRWPQATPPVPWPSYRDGDVYRDGAVYRDGDVYRDGAVYRDEERLDGQYAADHQVAYPATAGYANQRGYQRESAGYGAPGGYDAPRYHAPDYAAPRYAAPDYAAPEYDAAGYNGPEYDAAGYNGPEYDAAGYEYDRDGYGSITDGFDGAPANASTPASYPYPSRDRYPEPEPAPGRPVPPEPRASRALTAPDAGLRQDRWQAEQDRRRALAQRGLTVGACTGLLAVGVAIGVSTLAAAFVRPQAAPVIAVGGVLIDRVPAGLRDVAMTHFGSHGRIVLLTGMYLVIACLALGMGALSRPAAALGVAGLAAFTLLGAFVVITRPGGRPADVIPAVIGGIAGVAALLWLQRASAPVAWDAPGAPARGGGSWPVQPAHGGNRRSR